MGRLSKGDHPRQAHGVRGWCLILSKTEQKQSQLGPQTFQPFPSESHLILFKNMSVAEASLRKNTKLGILDAEGPELIRQWLGQVVGRDKERESWK